MEARAAAHDQRVAHQESDLAGEMVEKEVHERAHDGPPPPPEALEGGSMFIGSPPGGGLTPEQRRVLPVAEAYLRQLTMEELAQAIFSGTCVAALPEKVAFYSTDHELTEKCILAIRRYDALKKEKLKNHNP